MGLSAVAVCATTKAMQLDFGSLMRGISASYSQSLQFAQGVRIQDRQITCELAPSSGDA